MTRTIDTSILFVIGTLELGGAERHLALALPRLRQRGILPVVYSLSGRGELAPDLETAGVAVYTVWGASLLARLPRIMRRVLGLPLTFLALLTLIIRLRPQTIHMFLPAAYLIGGLAATIGRVPIRIMSRRSRNHYQAKHPFAGCVERLLHRRMTALLGNSRPVVLDLLGEGAENERVRLLHNGIPAFTAFPQDDAFAFRDSLGIPPNALVMTITANLIPYKGHADLLDALIAIKDEMPARWILLCVGDDRGTARQLARQANCGGLSDHVRWLGSRRDVDHILAASDMGILCSHEEGFSNAILEYMAAGLPAVVTNVGGNAEAVINDLCGLVVPARDPQRLGAAILRLANNADLRATLGTTARERVRRHFDIDGCVENYVRLYEALAHGAPLPALDTTLPTNDKLSASP